MNKLVGLIILVILQTALTACVELKDPDKGGNAPVPVSTLAEAQKLPNLDIDGEMFVYQDKILTQDQIDLLNFKKTPDWKPGSQTLRYGRITFTSRGKLYTMGNNLTLIADVFESDRGEIITFRENEKAAQGNPGLEGGYITLQPNHAEGQLFVVLRGQDGGDGRNGSPPEVTELLACDGHSWIEGRMDGHPGTNAQKGGNSGAFHVIGEAQPLFDVHRRSFAGHGGRPGMASQPAQCFTFGPPAVGHPASDGLPGADGALLE